MGKIFIDKQEFTFEQITAGQWPAQKPYMENSLAFCNEWLNGKKSFELKTSGSTGTPKSIAVSRSQMTSSAKATGDFFKIQPLAVMLCCLNTEMIAGKMMLVRAMEWDSHLHLVEPSSNPLMGFPKERSFDFATMVPIQLETCLQDEHSLSVLQQIKNLLLGGAPLSEKLRQKAVALPGNLYQTYGMTETVSHIALADIKSCGPLTYKTLPGVHIRQNSNLQLEIQAPMSNNTWIVTNDTVEIMPEGFMWKGRADFVLNTGGIKVQPEEVEVRISELMHQRFPNQRYFIAGLPDEKLGEKIVLVIEGTKEAYEDQERTLRLLKDSLPPFHHPKNLLFVPQFAETASNKINRKETLKNQKL